MKVGDNGIQVTKLWLTEAEVLGILALIHIQDQIVLTWSGEAWPPADQATGDQVLASLREKAQRGLLSFEGEEN